MLFPMPITSLPGANPSLPEHKIEVFVRFWGSEPSFSGISSTKSGFLCFFGLRNPHFRAFRAHNRHFCALLGSGTLVFGYFEHKIGVFVLGKGSGERAVTLVWSIMVCEEVLLFVFDLIWRVWELVLRGIVECCIFDFWRLGGDWLEMMGCGCWLCIGL